VSFLYFPKPGGCVSVVPPFHGAGHETDAEPEASIGTAISLPLLPIPDAVRTVVQRGPTEFQPGAGFQARTVEDFGPDLGWRRCFDIDRNLA